MHKRLATVVLTSIIVGLGTLMTSDANAGLAGDSAYCTNTSSGTGYCTGYFSSFRTASDPNAYATFGSYGYESTQSQWFQAELNGSYYQCNVTSAYPAVQAVWTQAMASHGFFQVYWTNNVCYYVDLSNTSAQ